MVSCGVDETFLKLVVVYHNSKEVVLTPEHAIPTVFHYKPASVILFCKTSLLGRCISPNALLIVALRIGKEVKIASVAVKIAEIMVRKNLK